MKGTLLNNNGRAYRLLSTIEQNIERYFMVVLYFYIFFIVATSVVTRYVFNFTPVWTTETAIFMYIYLTWLGASWNVRKRSHIRVDFVQKRLSERGRGLTYILNDLALLAFIYYVFVGFIPVWRNTQQLGVIVQSLNVSEIYFIFAVPLGFALIMIRSLQMLYNDVRAVVYDEPVYDGEAIIGGE